MVKATSALGEAIGKVFEEAVRDCLSAEVESRECSIRPAKLRNGTGNEYQIDAVVFDDQNRPLIIIDPKYIRYTKHNRDKGSWLCTAHYNLRKTHPSIRKSLAVLAGRWSAPSKSLIRSFSVEILEVSFGHMCTVLRDFGIEFDWDENGGEPIAQQSLSKFETLSDATKSSIGAKLVSPIANELHSQIVQILDTDIDSLASRVTEIEILLKTNQGEMVLTSFPTAPDAIRGLTNLVSDKPDIRSFFSHSYGEDH